MSCRVVIVDLGTGNLSSVRRSVARLGAECSVSSEPAEIERADKLILAGVGHFQTAMAGISRPGLKAALDKAVLFDRKPVLGICLGMELMAKTSEEGDAKGLGWIDADAVRFRISDSVKNKVPHIGWNSIRIKKDGPLMKRIPDSAEFYFNHSYFLKLKRQSDLLNETEYETTFTAAIQKDNIFGVQYHPEKSHSIGLQLLKNFIEL